MAEVVVGGFASADPIGGAHGVQVLGQ
jgi:hypothetical protein